MTTTDAAKYLGVTHEAMRQFGLTGAVACVTTSSPRLRLFRKGELRRVNEARADARVRRSLRACREVHPVMVKAGLKPRQFDLFGPKLRIVTAARKPPIAWRSPTHYTREVRKTG